MTDADAFRALACRYAQAIDRNLPALLEAIFTSDGELELRGVVHRGREELRQALAALKARYRLTFHAVHNQVFAIDGDVADGETYCVASHLLAAPGSTTLCYEMAIRYQDRLSRSDGVWRFARRRLVVDWTRVHQASPEDAP